MGKSNHKPELIIIAGPNGSGKTSITQKFLHHEWAEGTTYINRWFIKIVTHYRKLHPEHIPNHRFLTEGLKKKKTRTP